MSDEDGPEGTDARGAGALPAATSSATATQRAYFSVQAIQAATRSAARAEELERAHTGEWGDPQVGEHLQAVTSAVIYSAIFLEALVSEWFTDAAERDPGPGGGRLQGLEARSIELMKGWWDATEGRGVSPLERHQMALLFAGRPQMDKGSQPYQSAKALLELRNEVIHFRPHTITMGPDGKLVAKLRQYIEPNQMLPEPELYWPYGLLSASCAGWATDSALAFAREICERLGLEPYFDRFLQPDATGFPRATGGAS